MNRAIDEQVIVITGASSGIGRETALRLATEGANLVLAARNDKELRSVAREVEELGGHADVVHTDVASWKQVRHLAKEAMHAFGRIDTWINNAAVSEYAFFEDMTAEEAHRIINVGLMGQIYGSKAALEHMRKQGEGHIINVSSIAADVPTPLQTAYAAAKHGIKGFTRSLRLELLYEKSPVHVTLILPGSINTPFFEHAKSKTGVEPMPMPPIYEPQTVAKAVISAIQHPRREVYVGGAAKFMSLVERMSPALLDWYLMQGGKGIRKQQTREPKREKDHLFVTRDDAMRVRGWFQGTKKRSFYTEWFESSKKGFGFVAAAILALIGLGVLNKKQHVVTGPRVRQLLRRAA